jgi:hypothetical protein
MKIFHMFLVWIKRMVSALFLVQFACNHGRFIDFGLFHREEHLVVGDMGSQPRIDFILSRDVQVRSGGLLHGEAVQVSSGGEHQGQHGQRAQASHQ